MNHPTSSSDERTWATLTHLSALLGFFIPFGSIIGPLITWSIRRESSEFINENGKAAVNFNMTWTLIVIVLWIIWMMNFFVQIFSLIIESSGPMGDVDPFDLTSILKAVLFLIPIAGIYLFKFILMLIGTIRASSGSVFEYPLTFRFIK